MRRKRRQSVFLVCMAILVVGVILFLVLHNNEESYSSDYDKNRPDNTVQYGGKEYQYNEHLSNYLFMGIDTREPVTEYETKEQVGRADTIFLLSYNRVEKTVTCISIPRDTMANVRMIAADGTDLGVAQEHINMQYVFGDGKDESCRLMKEAVSALLYDIPIQGYCALNMDGIAAAVDVLGGVELVVPDNSLADVNPEFQEGATVMITKDNAEQFVRYRDIEKSQSAIVRTNRQKVFLKALSEQAQQQASENADLIVNMYEALQPYIVTNMGNDLFADLLSATFDSENGIKDIPGQGTEGELHDEYHIDETQLYELVLQVFYKEV